MKILVFGAGGIGSVLGGFLARSGHDVSLLGRVWHIDTIRREGLRITGLWGDYRIKAFELYTNAAEIQKKDPAFDLILLTVKSYDTERAVEELVPLMKPHTVLLSFQNGLGNIETVLKKVKPEQYLVGRVIFGVEISPGTAKVTVESDPVAIGPVPESRPLLSAERAANNFSIAKIPTVAVSDILPVIWSKVIYNSALNAICTLCEMPYGGILKHDDTRADMEEVVRECYAVGIKKGIKLNPPTAEAFIDLLKTKLIPETAAHYPSMLQDIKRKKRTDIDALNGAIARLGKELGIPTPANQKLTEQIRDRSS